MVLYFVFYNIIVLPVLFYLHSKGECSFIQPYLANATLPVCQYISNFWINVIVAEVFFIVIMLLVKAKLLTASTSKYREYAPKPFHKKEHF